MGTRRIVRSPISGGGGTLLAKDLNASNTGVPSGTSLIAVPGSATSGAGWAWNSGESCVQPTANGVTVSGLDIAGGFDGSGKTGWTLQNSLIRGTGIPDWVVQTGGGCTVQYCELGGGADGVTYIGGGTAATTPTGLYMGGSSARSNSLLYCNVHHTGDGIRGDGGVYADHSWIHTLNCGQAADVHSDGCQQTASAGPMEFSYCRIQGGTNDGIFLEVGDSPYNIHDCYFEGDTGPGGNTSFAIGGKTTNAPFAGTTTINNNTFLLDARLGSPIGNFPAGAVLSRSGNVDQNGTPISGG